MTQTQPKHYSNKQLNIKLQSIQINFVVAEKYSCYYGYAIFEQRPRKLAWGLKGLKKQQQHKIPLFLSHLDNITHTNTKHTTCT